MTKSTILIIIIFLLGTFSMVAQEDYRSRIAIVSMENGTGLEEYNPLCITITETVSLVLEFLRDYRVLDEQDADLTRLESVETLAELREIAVEEEIDEVVFGRAALEEGVFEFTLSLYNVNEGKITNEQSVEAFSVLEVFDAADELTEGLIGQLSDVHIAFGSVRLIQTGGRGNYTVNLDGFPLRNPDKTFRKVLNGRYEISITQERLIGRTVVFSEIADVIEDKETAIEFSLPPGLPEEFEWMENRGEALLVLGDSKDSIDMFLEEITLFQNETLALEYDPELEGLRDNYLKQAGNRAAELLRNRVEEADASFYGDNPSFSETLDSYEKISSLVDTQFDVKMLISSQDQTISEPQKVEVNESDTVYFSSFDQDENINLIGWDPEDGRIVSRRLSGKSGYYQGDFTIDGRRVFLWEPGAEQVEILDSSLNTQQTLPLPQFPAGEEGIKLAVSSKGLLYALSGRTVRVIDTTRQYDDDGNLLPPDRYSGTEQNLEKLINQIGGRNPRDIFFDQARHLNVFFPEASTLLQTDENGNILKEISFARCQSDSRIAADGAGYWYVTLQEENVIVKYSPAGELVTTYGEYGTEEGQFAVPTGIAVSSEGILYVADSFNARLQTLNPLTPPVLYPEIARYSEDLDRRIERTAVAADKEKSARDEISFDTHVWNFVGSGLLLGGAGILAITAEIAGANSAYAYEFYENSLDPDEISRARDTVEILSGIQAFADVGSITAFGFGASMLTATFLDIGLDSTYAKYNQRQAQLLDMNKLYEVDPEKYRSVRASSRIGVWTGVVPPIAGLATTLGIAFSGADVSPGVVAGVTAIGIGIPPIFSHLHGGRFSVGLLAAGLASDLLALGSIAALIQSDDIDWDYEKYSSYDSNPSPGPKGGANFNGERMFDRLGDLSFLYLLSGAYGIRIAAGIFDARYGWTYTNNYNRYRAVTEVKDSEVAAMDWAVNPYLDQSGALGMALNLSY